MCMHGHEVIAAEYSSTDLQRSQITSCELISIQRARLRTFHVLNMVLLLVHYRNCLHQNCLLVHNFGSFALIGNICAVLVQENPRRPLPASLHKQTSFNLTPFNKRHSLDKHFQFKGNGKSHIKASLPFHDVVCSFISCSISYSFNVIFKIVFLIQSIFIQFSFRLSLSTQVENYHFFYSIQFTGNIHHFNH